MSSTHPKARGETSAGGHIPSPGQSLEGPGNLQTHAAPANPAAAATKSHNDTASKSSGSKRPAASSDNKQSGAGSLRRQLGKELGVKFWVSVLSNALAGLITAWVIFLVASTVAVAALGADGTEIKWGEALSVAALCVLLGVTLTFAVWSATALVLPTPRRPPSYWWLLVVALAGALAISGWIYVPGTAAPIGLWITLLVTLAVLGIGVWAIEHSRPKPKLWRALIWGGLCLSLLGTVTTGVEVGVAIARAAS